MKFTSEMPESIFKSKYMLPSEKEPAEAVERIVSVVNDYFPEYTDRLRDYIINQQIGVAGGLYRAARNPNKNVSVINCTTLGHIDDTIESIANGWYRWAKYAAYGQGEGLDLSHLRPSGSPVHNSSRSSTGPVSFMYTYDAILSVISQQGRRGASLVSLSIRHPDTIDFVKVKTNNKDKTNPAGDEMFSTMNISLMVDDSFMEAVEKGEEWEFIYENEHGKISSKMDARELFDLIARNAWETGDPGLLFWDTASTYSNSNYLGYPIECTNACGEVPQDPDNVCLLSSGNLAKWDGEEESLRAIIRAGVRLLDAFRRYEIDENRSPIPEQRKKLVDLPRIGFGFTGLADYFIRNGYEYGSEASIAEVDRIFYILAEESYIESYRIARYYDKQSFPAYDKEAYKKSPFVQNLLNRGFDEKWLDYQAHVVKNAIAPTGTLSLIVEAGGSGIEPLFSKYFVRRERSTEGKWKEWFTFNDLVKQELEKQGKEVTKENADQLDPNLWVTAHHVNNHDKIKLVSQVQKWVDSAVSVTYNLARDCTPEDIKDIYMEAWKGGVKGVTVYREGSKFGVLITDDNYEASKQEVKAGSKNAELKDGRFSPPRPADLPCDIHKAKVQGVDHIVLIGLLDGVPYEVFAGSLGSLSVHSSKGILRKVKRGRYDLIVDEETMIPDIGSYFYADYGSLSRFISMSLRHGVPLPFIVDQLSKDKQFIGFERSVARVLKKYIQNGLKVFTSETCPSCGSTNLAYNDGCKMCMDCGWSKCD